MRCPSSSSSTSTGHTGLDNALTHLGYAPTLKHGLPPLLVVLPPPSSSSSDCPAAEASRVVRSLRHALSLWSIDAHQWDSRGTELQPVVDTWNPGADPGVRGATASRWAAGDTTRVLVATSPSPVGLMQEFDDAPFHSPESGWHYLLTRAPVKLAEHGHRVLVIALDDAMHIWPLPQPGPVTTNTLFTPAALCGTSTGAVATVGVHSTGEWSMLPSPASSSSSRSRPSAPMMVSMPTPPIDTIMLPAPPGASVPAPRMQSKRKRTLSEVRDDFAVSETWTRNKRAAWCAHQVDRFSSSRPASSWIAHPPSSPTTS